MYRQIHVKHTLVIVAVAAAIGFVGLARRERPSRAFGFELTIQAEGARGPVVERTPAGLIRANSAAGLVGRLRFNLPHSHRSHSVPARYCLADGLWRGTAYRLNRTNLTGFAGLPTFVEDEPVLVFAKPAMSMDDVITRLGPCPSQFSRGLELPSFLEYGIAPEGGPFTSHQKLARQPYLRGRAVTLLKLHEVAAVTNHDIQIRLFNPFDTAFDELALRVEYIGRLRSFHADYTVSIPAGGTADFWIPRRVVLSDRYRTGVRVRPWRLALEGRVGRTKIDVRLRLPRLDEK